MAVIRRLRKTGFSASIQLTSLCIGADCALFATGYIGPPPDLGNVLRLEPNGDWSRLGHRLENSDSIAYDASTNTLIVSANDGKTPGRTAPNGIFRITMDGVTSIVTRNVSGGGRFPVSTDSHGNIYYPHLNKALKDGQSFG
jgi:hypothetical protein